MQHTPDPDERETFRPHPSRGSLALVAGALGVAAFTVGPTLVMGEAMAATERALALTIGAAITVPLLVLAAALPGMRYEFDDGALHLRCPPFLHYRIPITAIERVERRDLEPSMWASLRLPGVALFTVPYNDAGKVRMCATRASRGIVLLRTPSATYGCTPQEADGFVDALRARQPS